MNVTESNIDTSTNATLYYRRQGVGSLLLKNFIRKMVLDNIKRIELEVRKNNFTAVEFYKKHRFEIIDIISIFYQNKEDAYIMRLII